MKKTKEEIDLEYFEKMKNFILDDIKIWRDISVIMWSINRYSEWWKSKLQAIYDEYHPKQKKELTEFEILTELKLQNMIKNNVFPFDNLPKELKIKPLW